MEWSLPEVTFEKKYVIEIQMQPYLRGAQEKPSAQNESISIKRTKRNMCFMLQRKCNLTLKAKENNTAVQWTAVLAEP